MRKSGGISAFVFFSQAFNAIFSAKWDGDDGVEDGGR